MNIPSNIWKPLALIALVILIATALARIMTGSQTLSDYASKHPEEQVVHTENDTDSEKDSSNDSEIDSLNQSNSGQLSSAKETFIDDEPQLNSNSNESGNTDMNLETAPYDEYTNSEKRITVADGFYYEPIPSFVKDRIMGISYPSSDALISLDELSYLSLCYVDFNGDIQTGEMICNAEIAEDVLDIFYQLYKAGYQLEKVKLVDEYHGDDELSMLDNNTSAFNYRVIAGTTKLSNHAKGLAVDINPYYNPYVTYPNGEEHVAPTGAEKYADRTQNFPYKIDENDLCYKLFINRGFTWGGNWSHSKDYQHFEKVLDHR